MEEVNKEFLKWSVNWDLVERPTQKVEIDEDLIQSGDYFAVLRLDGLDPMIMYGTGSHSGHIVILMNLCIFIGYDKGCHQKSIFQKWPKMRFRSLRSSRILRPKFQQRLCPGRSLKVGSEQPYKFFLNRYSWRSQRAAKSRFLDFKVLTQEFWPPQFCRVLIRKFQKIIVVTVRCHFCLTYP